MDILGIVGIPAIAIICYLVGMGLKAWDMFDDRKIPWMMLAAGCVLGLISHIWWPSLVPANDPITAGAIGTVSGALATTINQIWKQAHKEE